MATSKRRRSTADESALDLSGLDTIVQHPSAPHKKDDGLLPASEQKPAPGGSEPIPPEGTEMTGPMPAFGPLGRWLSQFADPRDLVSISREAYGDEVLTGADVTVREVRRLRPLLRLSLAGWVIELKLHNKKLYQVVRTATVHREASMVSHALPFEKPATRRLEKGLLGLPNNTGVSIIFGKGGVGKTPLALRIADAMRLDGIDTKLELFGEPEGQYLTEYDVLLERLVQHLIYGRSVVIDSLKNPVYDTPGNASGGGMSASLWPTLSDLSAVFDRCGCSLITVINPTTSKKEVFDNAAESLKVSTMSLLIGKADNKWDMVWRDRESGIRSAITFSSTVDEFSIGDSSVRYDNRKPVIVDDGRTSIVDDYKLSVGVDELLVNALSRILSN